MSEREDRTKVWHLDDPFEYAPEKSEGDPWGILLEPLLKKDRMQCDAWKEEVQNLLIFPPARRGHHGWSTLLHRLDNPRNSDINSTFITPPNPFSLSASFSPTPSSVRVNIFWFISLVLSLTTVLVGIISLQWLREHQLYPDLSPKQSFAVFRMRNDGLEKWHVSKVFTALPLLLQTALILFLGGLVDFLFALRNNVAVPVAVCIALSLFFLTATTTLPTLQGFALYFPFLYSRKPLGVPAQCPYKSPQSHAFRTMSHLGFHACTFLFHRLRKLLFVIRRIFGRPFYSETKEENVEIHHLIPYISPTWRQSTWTQFDLGWLSVRDAYLQGIYDQGSELHKHRKQWNGTFPLFDALQGLREIGGSHGFKHTSSFLAAAYHAFEELSLYVIGHNAYFESVQHGPDYYERHNQYLQNLLTYGDAPRSKTHPRLSEFIYVDTSSSSWDWSLNGLRLFQALHHENLFIFLSHMTRFRTSQEANILSTHRLEIQIRLMRYAYEDDHTVNLESNIPSCLKVEGAEFEDLGWNTDNERTVEHEFFSQYLNIFASFMRNVGDIINPDELSASLYSHRHIPAFMQDASWITILATRQSDTQSKGADLKDCFVSILKSVAQRLECLIISTSSADQPGLLLYLTALYVKPLTELLSRERDHTIYSGIDILFPIMRNYRRQHEGAGNLYIEDQFKGEDSDGSTRFSTEWWEFLEPQAQGLSSTSPIEDFATIPAEEKSRAREKSVSASIFGREDTSEDEAPVAMASQYMEDDVSLHANSTKQSSSEEGKAQLKMNPKADNLV